MNDTLCAQLIATGVIAKAYADMAGLGVIFAFIFSACLTLVTVLASYCFGFIDDGLLRPVDRLVLRVPSHARQHVRLHTTLRKVVLALSDQQIVTGIAILGAGFVGLVNGTITVYHFQIVIYLAWMSSSVHLSALTLLRPYLLYHRGLLMWRMVGMLTLLIMLFIALVPTVSNDWAVVWPDPNDLDPIAHHKPYTLFGVPAQCFWGKTYGSGVNPDAVLSYLVLFVSYLWKIGGLFTPVRSSFERWLRNPLDWTLEKLLGHTARLYERHPNQLTLWAFRLSLTIFMTMTATFDVLGSFSAALWLSTLGLIYGIMQIVIPRELMRDIDPSIGVSEAQLGFGQLVPLILLVQPFGAATERLWVAGQGNDEEEGLLQDPHFANSSSHTTSWDLSEDTRSVPKLSDRPLLQHMATYNTPPVCGQGPQRFQLRALVYTSKLFHLVIWTIHAAVAAIAGIVFRLDYQTIGYDAGVNWYTIVIGVGIWMGGCPTITLFLCPFSRLGKYYKCHRPSTSKAKIGEEHNSKQPLEMETVKCSQTSTSTKLESSSTAPLDTQESETWAAEWRRRSNATVELGERQGEVWATEWRRRSVAQLPKTPDHTK